MLTTRRGLDDGELAVLRCDVPECGAELEVPVKRHQWHLADDKAAYLGWTTLGMRRTAEGITKRRVDVCPSCGAEGFLTLICPRDVAA